MRYVENILVFINENSSDAETTLVNLNKMSPKLKFTLELENDKHINFLDIAIFRNNNNREFKICGKPIRTDRIIPENQIILTNTKWPPFIAI
ncbi:hypothetical protein NQ314_018052 [Rhamnusium bicolor]|uniref:Uncharacterized protein n=1 Tax=Rhamnusium bicolor TaxID=1586634 RepID=A0AAV8WR72_9CUCU|nr:hypothetical protein NQ314_018052 [Rhamnusium bicolor]